MLKLLLFLLGVLIDQGSKYAVSASLRVGEAVPVIPGFFSLRHVVNRGAAWSLFAGREWGIYFLTALSAVAFLILAAVVYTRRNTREAWSLLAITTGCFGNLIDRVLHRGVTDFLAFQFGPYAFPVFNVADVFLVCGVALLAYRLLREPADGFRRKEGARG